MWNEVCYVSTYVSRTINRLIDIWERFKMIKLLPVLRGLRDRKTENFDIELPETWRIIGTENFTIPFKKVKALKVSLILLPKSFSLCSRTLILIFFKSQ